MHNIDPSNNLGSYASHKIPDSAHNTFIKYIGYNSINKNEYPEIAKSEDELTSLFAKMCSISNLQDAVGTATTGSTEAAMIALLSAKLRWHKDWSNERNFGKCNVILDINSHHSWHRICDYLDVETRYYKPLEVKNGYVFSNNHSITSLIDKNTILVLSVVGYTTLGVMDNISDLDTLIWRCKINSSKLCWDGLMIHVDAAIGGFTSKIYNALSWGFELDNVGSINLSNHKYGFVYPGLGWVLFKNSNLVDKSLYKETTYLQGTFTSMGFTFTKNGAHIMASLEVMKNYGRYLSNVMDLSKIVISELLNNPHIEIFDNIVSPAIYWTGESEYLSRINSELMKQGVSVPISNFETVNAVIPVQRIVPRYGMEEENLISICNKINSI